MQLAHAVDRATAAYRQVRHIEGFLVVVGILPSQGHQVPEREAQLTFGVIAEMLPHQVRREAIETRGHGGVRGEEIPSPGHLERHVEGLPGCPHEIRGPLQDGEGGVAFIQVAHFRIDPQGAQQPPAADAQHESPG